MQKRDVVDGGKVSSKNLSAMKCGECLHFATTPHSTKKGEVCSKIGIRAEGTAPSCFTPNVKELHVSSEMIVQVTSLMSTLDKTQRRILASLMMSKQKKLKFGTKVYFRPMGKEFMSNYRSGYVVGYSSTGDLLIIGDPDPNRRGNSFVATLKSDEEVLTPSQWKERRADLKAKNLINDPSMTKIVVRSSAVDDHEPAPHTMDSVPDHFYSKKEPAADAPGKTRKTKKTMQELDFRVED